MKYKNEYLVAAYGSNLCEYDFNRFVTKNGGDKECLHFEEIVYLPDYELSKHSITCSTGSDLYVEPVSY